MKRVSESKFNSKFINRAVDFLEKYYPRHSFNWDHPTSEDFKVWEHMKDAGVLVDDQGNPCSVINGYGPNPLGLEKPSDINKMYIR